MTFARDEAGDPVVLKWWPIIGALLVWSALGLIAFGSVRSEIATVATELSAHEKAQADTIDRMQRDLTYIRERLDRALEHQK